MEYFGYRVRNKLFPSEDLFFSKNKNVSGMASETGDIILNPYSNLSKDEFDAVAKNEAVRLFMRENKISPEFDITKEQESFFSNTPYAKYPNEKRQTIIARILSGDPSVTPTQQQIEIANQIMQMIGSKK